MVEATLAIFLYTSPSSKGERVRLAIPHYFLLNTASVSGKLDIDLVTDSKFEFLFIPPM